MPRYFFNVHNGQVSPYRELPDEDGTVLSGPEEARAQAVTAAGEMLKDLDGKFWSGADWTMAVSDEEGATVCILRFSGSMEDERTKVGARNHSVR